MRHSNKVRVTPGKCGHCAKNGATLVRNDSQERAFWFHRDCWPTFCEMIASVQKINDRHFATWPVERRHGR